MRKNSRVPCVASPNATTRASPTMLPISARSSNPDPGASVVNGRATDKSQATAAASTTDRAPSKSRFDNELAIREYTFVWTALSAVWGNPLLVPVVGTFTSTTSSCTSSIRAVPRPEKRQPTVIPTAVFGTSSTMEYCVQPREPTTARLKLTMLSKPRIPVGPSTRIHMPAPPPVTESTRTYPVILTRFPR